MISKQQRMSGAMRDSSEQPDSEALRAYEVDIALGVAWLVSMVRAFRVTGERQEGLDEAIHTARADLMRGILRACAAGVSLEEVRSGFIEPALSRPGVTKGAAALLEETMRSAQACLAVGRPCNISLPVASA
jgi:hypothetical protein